LPTRSGSRATCAGCAAIALLVFATPHRSRAADRPRPRNESAGLALGLGAGAAFPLLGGGLIYSLPLPSGTRHPLTVSASVGLGILSGPDSTLYLDSSSPPNVLGTAATVGIGYGRRHRICAELGYGAFATQALAIEGILVDVQARYGVFANVGYEFAANNGFLLRLLPLGFGRYTSPLIESKDRSHWSNSLFVGWRLW
jgi:hypothetical protein